SKEKLSYGVRRRRRFVGADDGTRVPKRHPACLGCPVRSEYVKWRAENRGGWNSSPRPQKGLKTSGPRIRTLHLRAACVRFKAAWRSELTVPDAGQAVLRFFQANCADCHDERPHDHPGLRLGPAALPAAAICARASSLAVPDLDRLARRGQP